MHSTTGGVSLRKFEKRIYIKHVERNLYMFRAAILRRFQKQKQREFSLAVNDIEIDLLSMYAN